MSVYPTGAVARATVRGQEDVLVMHLTGDWVSGQTVHGWMFHDGRCVTDVRPLVLLEATRETGDSLTFAADRLRRQGYTAQAHDLYLIAAAIREQTTPTPEWTLDYSTSSGCDGAPVDVMQNGKRVARFDRADQAERAIQILNAAEEAHR